MQVTAQVDALTTSVLEELATALGQPTMQVTMQVAAFLELAAQAEQPREVLQEGMGLTDREHFRKQYLLPIMQAGWLVRTLNPHNHPQQRYRITPKGQAWVDSFNALPKP